MVYDSGYKSDSYEKKEKDTDDPVLSSFIISPAGHRNALKSRAER